MKIINILLLIGFTFMAIHAQGEQPNPFAIDFYERIGVSRSADSTEIKRAYRRAAVKYHPDRSQLEPDQAKIAMQNINEAYETLSDEQARQRYDRNGAPRAAKGPSFNEEETQETYQSYEDLRYGFSSMYRSASARRILSELNDLFPDDSSLIRFWQEPDLTPRMEALLFIAGLRAVGDKGILNKLLRIMTTSSPEYKHGDDFVFNAMAIRALTPLRNEPSIIKALSQILMNPERHSTTTIQTALESLIQRREERLAKTLLWFLSESPDLAIQRKARKVVKAFDIQPDTKSRCEIFLQKGGIWIKNARQRINEAVRRDTNQ